jgi:hypothetical protein
LLVHADTAIRLQSNIRCYKVTLRKGV